MRVWVAGGAGFIGSHLCDKLLQRGATVRCVDNLSSGREENLRNILTSPNFELVVRDACDVWPLPISALKRPDIVYYLASLASPRDYRQFPLETIKVNTLGLLNAMEFAVRAKARLVYVSTSEVYGDPESLPQVETSSGYINPTSARASYCLSKAVGETIVYRFGYPNVSVIRIFNTYGPRMRATDGRCVPTFIRQALNGEALTLFKPGEQTRSLCYVDDTVQALLLAGSRHVPPIPINVGSDVEVSLRFLAERIVSLCKSRSPIELQPNPDAEDPKRRQPDLRRAERYLGWVPTTGLNEGLLKTIRATRGIV